MITVNMHEAKTRLSQLVKAVEEQGEIIILQRAGKPVARILPAESAGASRRDLTPDPRFAVQLAPGYDPTEPLDENEWPEECR
jgi:prevent-host-death family protein